ncbi:MAG: hypothetical protein NT052_00590 [Candidatus Shapirobacteria bacterium]|nr:hypothetical protein [Candidatus Shapirobacteria bacterium]
MKKPIKKPKLLILITILITGLSLTQLVISHSLATTGGKMRQLEEKASVLAEQNRVLAEEINQMGSLTRVASEAQKLGLIKANQIFHLSSQVPVALENTTLSLER